MRPTRRAPPSDHLAASTLARRPSSCRQRSACCYQSAACMRRHSLARRMRLQRRPPKFRRRRRLRPRQPNANWRQLVARGVECSFESRANFAAGFELQAAARRRCKWLRLPFDGQFRTSACRESCASCSTRNHRNWSRAKRRHFARAQRHKQSQSGLPPIARKSSRQATLVSNATRVQKNPTYYSQQTSSCPSVRPEEQENARVLITLAVRTSISTY